MVEDVIIKMLMNNQRERYGYPIWEENGGRCAGWFCSECSGSLDGLGVDWDKRRGWRSEVCCPNCGVKIR